MSAPAPAAAAPSATPSNGASSRVTAPAATPAPKQDVPTGKETPAPKSQTAAAVPEDDDPEIDFGDVKMRRSAAKRELDRARTTSRLLNEAEKRNKAAEALEKAHAERRSKKDIAAIIDDLGLTPEEEKRLLSERIYSKHIAPEQMSAEQREISELKERLAAREAADKKAADAAAEQKKRAVLDEEGKKLHAEIIAAAEAGKIPKSRRAIQRIMDKAISFDSRGMELPLEQIAALVREDVAQDMVEFADGISIAERKALMGDEAFLKEQKRWHAYFKAMLPGGAGPAQTVRAPPQRASDGTFKKQQFTPQEFLARINGRK